MINLVSIIYTLFSLTYTILAGKGKYICFFFGLFASVLYGILCFINHLWGSLALNVLYYIPIQILSFILWFKNTDEDKKTVKKISLGRKEFFSLLILALILSICAIYFLNFINDKSPFFDGIILIFSILGAYFTLRRAIEQWIIWSIVNVFSCIMWLIFIPQNPSAIAPSVLWFIYLILGIVFYFEWKREVN